MQRRSRTPYNHVFRLARLLSSSVWWSQVLCSRLQTLTISCVRVLEDIDFSHSRLVCMSTPDKVRYHNQIGIPPLEGIKYCLVNADTRTASHTGSMALLNVGHKWHAPTEYESSRPSCGWYALLPSFRLSQSTSLQWTKRVIVVLVANRYPHQLNLNLNLVEIPEQWVIIAIFRVRRHQVGLSETTHTGSSWFRCAYVFIHAPAQKIKVQSNTNKNRMMRRTGNSATDATHLYLLR